MSHTYCIADIHGRFDLLCDALIAIAEHHGSEPCTVVLTGDYVDRGPQSAQIIRRLMDGVTNPHKLVCLRGNHEDIMWLTCRGGVAPRWWLGNGGGQTLISYGHKLGAAVDLSVINPEHLDWIESLPRMHVDKHRVFVHAGVDPDVPLDMQDEEIVAWKLYQDFDERGHGDFHVVHGHHQFEDGPLLYAGRTDLDTFAWATGRLVVGVFDDDKPGGPVDLIEVIGEPDPRFTERK